MPETFTAGDELNLAAVQGLGDAGPFGDGLVVRLRRPLERPVLVRPVVSDLGFDWMTAFEEAVRPELGSRIAIAAKDTLLAASIARDAAAWMADGGQRIVLVDASVESPVIGKALLEDSDEGLVDGVVFGVSPSIIVRRTLAAGVRLVTSGSYPVSARGVFESERFDQTMAALDRNGVVLIVIADGHVGVAARALTTVVAVGRTAAEIESIGGMLTAMPPHERPHSVAMLVTDESALGTEAEPAPTAAGAPEDATAGEEATTPHVPAPPRVWAAARPEPQPEEPSPAPPEPVAEEIEREEPAPQAPVGQESGAETDAPFEQPERPPEPEAHPGEEATERPGERRLDAEEPTEPAPVATDPGAPEPLDVPPAAVPSVPSEPTEESPPEPTPGFAASPDEEAAEAPVLSGEVAESEPAEEEPTEPKPADEQLPAAEAPDEEAAETPVASGSFVEAEPPEDRPVEARPTGQEPADAKPAEEKPAPERQESYRRRRRRSSRPEEKWRRPTPDGSRGRVIAAPPRRGKGKKRGRIATVAALLALLPVIALIVWRVNQMPDVSWRFWEREEPITVDGAVPPPTGEQAPTEEPEGVASTEGATEEAGAPTEGQTEGEPGAAAETEPGVASGAVTEVSPDALEEAPAVEVGPGQVVSEAGVLRGTGGPFRIFVSSHRQEGAAGRDLTELAARGVDAAIIRAELPERGVWYRVAVAGGYPSFGSATEVLDTVKELGYEGAWVERVSQVE